MLECPRRWASRATPAALIPSQRLRGLTGGACRWRLAQAFLLLLGQAFVLFPLAVDRLPLLGRHVLEFFVPVAHLRALFRSHAGPLLHPRLEPLLLLGCHRGVLPGDPEPLVAARALDLRPLLRQRRQYALLLWRELSPIWPALFLRALASLHFCRQAEEQQEEGED